MANNVNLQNIQARVFPKKKQEFIFFNIKDAVQFKAALPKLKVDTSHNVLGIRRQIETAKARDAHAIVSVALVNISFSRSGLTALGIFEHPGGPDDPFEKGQLADAANLGDVGTRMPDDSFDPSWELAFKSPLDGVLNVAGDSLQRVKSKIAEIEAIFGRSIEVINQLKGTVRPRENKGHEHFGWSDGISNPTLRNVGGIPAPLPGQLVVSPGVIICGRLADPVADRPEWATDGSFLAFRKLQQLVPEFRDFLLKNPLQETYPDRRKGSELLGAKLFGRWPSGAPIQLSPLDDDPALGADPQRNNLFNYPNDHGDAGQNGCPYSAHIRKTQPRGDLAPSATEQSGVFRTSIAYGPELSEDEKNGNTTEFSRGLAFLCYQSSLNHGFRFIQTSWANNIDFINGRGIRPGYDAIIGQNSGRARETLGTTEGYSKSLPMDFVVSCGGEYFFSPSIEALRNRFIQ
ncbi:Dyp-type peroxidase family [Rhizoctonia solani]|uniref:Dyp-type peroxidase family n=1 Tax=Rhizoctonia solani TaxID=456999 RepID=A0A8H8NLV1_9AGAM|nr:Dyp-type peroxidase family [Rhizoctonia solani]QRW15530.1 Dyp-type peroxidase family [Rhizoctonia solani]